MVYDFHTHTILSDGDLTPTELVRRAVANGYTGMAITDHVGIEDQARVLDSLVTECRVLSDVWSIPIIPGVELTHVPKKLISDVAGRSKEKGAQIVIVHGETIVEPVEPGTNLSAIKSDYVDILAHPGLLTDEEAHLAAERGIILELSARRGHSLTNGRVARVALTAGAKLIIDSDAHQPDDLLTEIFAEKVAYGAGLSQDLLPIVLKENPLRLLTKLEVRINSS